MTEDGKNQYLLKSYEKYEITAQSITEQINKSETEAVRQLIFTATVFLTASLFLLQGRDLNQSLDVSYKILLVLAWISFGSSMLCGITIFLKDVKFFSLWLDANNKIVSAIRLKLVPAEKLDELAELQQKDIPEQTSNSLLYVEIILLITGIIFLFIVMSKFIF